MEKDINIEDMLREHDLTVEEVKSFPMFAPFSDEQAEEVILTIKRFAEIIYKVHQKDKESATEGQFFT
ncbi:MAG: hypothetical protein EOO20_00460 [Chryseobacterium sp.]|nr:MAG: hypothetical protein EOO20_00460 [Chryseobacterium sp.]